MSQQLLPGGLAVPASMPASTSPAHSTASLVMPSWVFKPHHTMPSQSSCCLVPAAQLTGATMSGKRSRGVHVPAAPVVDDVSARFEPGVLSSARVLDQVVPDAAAVA